MIKMEKKLLKEKNKMEKDGKGKEKNIKIFLKLNLKENI